MKLLKPESAAELLAISRSTLLRMIRDGVLPAVCMRSGKRKKIWRIRQEVLERWILTNEKETSRKRAQASTPTAPGILESHAQPSTALAASANAS
jgi:excisionase family DNA binding protein